ncbi:hypothetical protein B0H17DRAFT_1201760 [Mycena rosella]|uniref:DDE-1 domain-containing protein n=1 Tax=Mycena rosella TaxID=1033263 RepID=A0AAD7GIX8_MYCRO|nr:hypothetical protein B0H17DRAFT_1201760 [Mycena rosella]
MFSKSAAKRPRTESVSSDHIEMISPPPDVQFPPPFKRAKTHDDVRAISESGPSSSAHDLAVRDEEAEFTSDKSDLLEEPEVPPEQLETEARLCDGDAAIDAIVAADDIADWVYTILDDAASKEPDELEALAVVNPTLLQRHVNSTLLPSLSKKKTTISIRHCQRWLWGLGYRRKRHHIGVYWDGHERKDIKKRRKAYLAELQAFEHLRATYLEPQMLEILELDDNEVEHVVIVHDESTLHSNDYQNNHYWLKEGEQVLKKKERGRLIMVSGFLCERYGLLALPDDMVAENEKLTAELRLAFTDSTTVIYPDNKAGGNTYWNMEQMIAQLVKAILIARHLFPNAIIHWVFDNSSAHGSLALTVSKMNITPGGKVPTMRDTIIPLDNPHGHGGKVQTMSSKLAAH